jgi:hypothetical protein
MILYKRINMETTTIIIGRTAVPTAFPEPRKGTMLAVGEAVKEML